MNEPARILSPIAIDLGGKHTGIHLFHYDPALSSPQFSHSQGHVVALEAARITFSQAERRLKRHMRRTIRRRKLAKRLVRLILAHTLKADLDTPVAPNQTAHQFVMSCLNRRGFTWRDAEAQDDDVDDADIGVLATEFPALFNERENLRTQLGRLTSFPEKLAELHSLFFVAIGPRDLKRHPLACALLEKHQVHRDEVSRVIAAMRAIQNAVAGAQGDEGHKHRSEYLANIQHDVESNAAFRQLLESAGWTPKQMAFLLGNVSNFQLRLLRRYFNVAQWKGQRDGWDPERLFRLLKLAIEGWHPKGSGERARRKGLLQSLEKAESILAFLQATPPTESIPFFEDQNNRRPPKCQSLVLDPQALDKECPSWERIASKILSHPKQRELAGASDSSSKEARARALQRVLDRSRNADPFLLSDISDVRPGKRVSSRLEQARDELSLCLGNDTKAFLDLLARYEEEAGRFRRGAWGEESQGNLLRLCGKHPRHKHRERRFLIAHLLRKQLSDGEFSSFLAQAWLAKPPQARRMVKSIAKECAELQKQHGANLKEIIRSIDVIDKDLEKTKKLAVLAMGFLREKVGCARGDDTPPIEAASAVFSLGQMFNILEVEQQGFSKACHECVSDNNIRSSENGMGGWHSSKDGWGWSANEKVARCNRLPCSTVRPFDGFLARMLDRIALEIASLKKAHLDPVLTTERDLMIPIIIEENRFEFSEGLIDIKGIKGSLRNKKEGLLLKAKENHARVWSGKTERIKAASRNICPYTGHLIGSKGQMDHVISQSASRKLFGYVFNSEANLIWASVEGNRVKNNQDIELQNLAASYLNACFGTCDIAAIQQRIRDVTDPLLSRPGRIHFQSLTEEQQLCFRHGLFVPDLRRRVANRLHTHQATRVNGTQAWLAKRVIFHLRRMLPIHRKISYATMGASAETSSLMRESLANEDPSFAKTERQSARSHVIDALLAGLQGLYALEEIPESHAAHLNRQGFDVLKSALPPTVEIQTLSRRESYRRQGRDTGSTPILNARLYAERYLPVLVSATGEVSLGFNLKNSVKIDGRVAQRLYAALQPYLDLNGGDAPMHLDDVRKLVGPRPYAWLTINKPKLNAAMHSQWQTNCINQELVKFAEALGYNTQKKGLLDQFLSKNKVTTEINKEIYTIKVDLGKCSSGEVRLPFADAWEKLAKDPALNERAGQSVPPTDPFWQDLARRHFPQQASERKHKSVRKVFSLPAIKNPTPGWRVRRRTPEGNECWQLASLECMVSQGMARQGQRVAFDSSVLAKHLEPERSRSLCPLKPNAYEIVRGEVCENQEWRTLPGRLIADISGVLRAEIRIGTKDRSEVRVTQDFASFKAAFAQYTKDLDGIDSGHAIPPQVEIQKEHASRMGAFLGKEILGKPRPGKKTVLRLEATGDVVRYVFTAERCRALKDAFNAEADV